MRKNGRNSWRRRLTIRTKLLLAFLALSVLSLVVVGSVALDRQSALGDVAVTDSTNALKDEAEDRLVRMAKDHGIISNAMFERVQGETEILAVFASNLWADPSSFGSRPSYSQDQQPPDIYAASVYALAPGVNITEVEDEIILSSNLDDVFIPVYAQNPDLEWIYIGTPSGVFRCYPWYTGLDPSYDPRIRPWYLGAIETGRLGWSETYTDAATGELMVTCFKPVNDQQGQLVGVVGADVSIQTIYDSILGADIGESGYAFLINEDSYVIARPGMSPGDETERLLESDNPDLRAIAAEMTAGNAGIAKCCFEDGERYVAYAPVTTPNWSIGIVIPIEEVIAPALATGQKIDNKMNSTQITFIVIFAVLVVVVSILAFWASRVLTNPIRALMKGSEAIGGGNLDHIVEVKSGDELEDLANSFNTMASDLKVHVEELRRTTAEKERIASELAIASGIQQSFLPESSPQVEGVDLAAMNSPATEVGGDFYDFIPVSVDKWGLVIADVSGKGVPAALFMALSRTLVRANATGNPSASEAILRANRLISEDDRSSMFVTLFYGVFDPKRKTLTYVSAGHNPPLMFPGSGGATIMLKTKGIALGVMPEIELEEKEITLAEGDIVVLYTDGVTEAINDQEEQFGQERLDSVVAQYRNLPASEIVEQIHRAVLDFAGGQPQFDDITVMVLKSLPHEGESVS